MLLFLSHIKQRTVSIFFILTKFAFCSLYTSCSIELQKDLAVIVYSVPNKNLRPLVKPDDQTKF